jgi:hypothetical protein
MTKMSPLKVILFFSLALVARTADLRAQEIKSNESQPPKIFIIDNPPIPRGCSYVVDDWKDNTIGWISYGENVFYTMIDGLLLKTGYRFHGDRLNAENQEYAIMVEPTRTLRTEHEYIEEKAVYRVKEKASGLQTNLIVRIRSGC